MPYIPFGSSDEGSELLSRQAIHDYVELVQDTNYAYVLVPGPEDEYGVIHIQPVDTIAN